jgi:hypothetical protein
MTLKRFHRCRIMSSAQTTYDIYIQCTSRSSQSYSQLNLNPFCILVAEERELSISITNFSTPY